jgi:hypothetical protein
MIKYHFVFLFIVVSFSLNGQDFYDLNKIQEIRLTIDTEHWDNKLNAYKKQGLDKRVLGTLEVNGVKYDSVGIRYKGNSSYFNTRKEGSSKLPLNIKLNYIKKNQTLPGGYKRIKLSNVFRDPSFLREVLSYEIVGDYMPAPRANFAKVYINDTYLGLYNSTENVASRFLDNYFGESDGVFFKCDPVWKATNIPSCKPNQKSTLVYLGKDTTCYTNSYEKKSDTGWENLQHLTDVLNNKTENIEQVLNVDQVLWMLAFNSVLVNLDSYTGRLAHNYYLYQDSSGVFHPIIWDLNMSFGGFRFDGTGKALDNEGLQRVSPFIHYKTNNPDRPLISKLFKNSLYRKVYLAHMRSIIDDHFNNGKYKERAKAVQTLIDEEVKNDSNKLYDYEGFKQNLDESTMAKTSKIIGITELMENRLKYLNKHPVFQKPAPVISEVTHTDYEDGVSISAKVIGNEDKNGKLLKVYLVYRNEKNHTFQKVELFDDGAHRDFSEGDLIYANHIEKLPKTEYYIIAEGERMATLSPEKASFEFYKIEP